VFFFLSKILDILLSPLAWSVILVLVGLTGSGTRRRWVGFAGVLVLLVFSLEPVSNGLFGALERGSRTTFRSGVTYDAVILLGGVTDERAEVTWGQRSFNDNNERLLETYDLLRTGAAKNAILSGGDIVPTPKVEAKALADQLALWGIDPSRLVVEAHARNTRENAVFSAEIVREHGWHDVLLVTSAFHMPRAVGCFRAVGLPADALPVDYRSYGGEYRGELIPRVDHLQQSNAAIREWFGRRIYSLRGYAR
jgi:uncharacterized SAM-binding protein YcdF (DUF218 family)